MRFLTTIHRLLDSLLRRNQNKGKRKVAYHFIRPKRNAHIKAWVAGLFLFLGLNLSAASIHWSVSGVTTPLGAPSSIGTAWLIIGQNPSPTVAAILAGNFNPIGGLPVSNGAVTGGRLTVPGGKATVYTYLVIVEPAQRYYISGVRANVAGDTIAFTSPVGWVTIPEPGSLWLLYLGIAAILTRRK